MIEKSKKRKSGSITETDVATLLQRYSATTVLTLLQEVAEAPPKLRMDWKELVSKTSTGISSPREYQMLWRHLAYRHSLLNQLDCSSQPQPLDDDSDIEYELEASPAVNNEALVEAASCVKVLIESASLRHSSHPNGTTIEAPLTVNIPISLTSGVASDNSSPAGCIRGTNITIPVYVQKQQLPSVTCAEGLDVNGSTSNFPPRKKRKPWSAAEDMELIAGVQKFGEGNWATILKGDFKGDRTASQLSQRWHIIRKRQGTVNVNVKVSSQLSEAQLAARRAVSLALNMPMGDKLKTTGPTSTVGVNSNGTPSNSARPLAAAESSQAGTPPKRKTQMGSNPNVSQGTAGPLKSHVLKQPSAKPNIATDQMIKAAAVAAGARIATPSDAASLMKAAQSKNAVYIMPRGISVIKSSVIGSKGQLSSNGDAHAASQHSTYSMPVSNAQCPGATQQTQGQLAASRHEPEPAGSEKKLHVPSEVANPVHAVPTNECVRTSKDVTNSEKTPKKLSQQDRDVDAASVSEHISIDQVPEDQATLCNSQSEKEVEETQTFGLSSATKVQNQDDCVLVDSPIKQKQVALPSVEVKEGANLACFSSLEGANNNDHASAACKSTDNSGTAFPGKESRKSQDTSKGICDDHVTDVELNVTEKSQVKTGTKGSS